MRSRENNKRGNDKNLTARDERLKCRRGSYEAQRWLAREEAEALEANAPTDSQRDVFLLYQYAAHALDHAVMIAKMTRMSTPLRSDRFVAEQVRLSDYVERLEGMSNLQDLLRQWPKDPGVTFGSQAGRSALDAAIQFAKMIRGGTAVARKELAVHGATSYDSLLVAPEPDPRFDGWRDETIRELLSHEIPKPDMWPSMADIHREYNSLQYKLEDEYKQMVALVDRKSEEQPAAQATTAGCQISQARNGSQVETGALEKEEKTPSETRVDRWINKTKNHPIIAVLIFIAVAVIGLGILTKSLDDIWSIVSKRVLNQSEVRAPQQDVMDAKIVTATATVEIVIASEEEGEEIHHVASTLVALGKGREALLTMSSTEFTSEQIGNNLVRYWSTMSLHPASTVLNQPLSMLKEAEYVEISVRPIPSGSQILSGRVLCIFNGDIPLEVPISAHRMSGEVITIRDIDVAFNAMGKSPISR